MNIHPTIRLHMPEPAVGVISPKSMVKLADWLSVTIAVVNLTSRQL